MTDFNVVPVYFRLISDMYANVKVLKSLFRPTMTSVLDSLASDYLSSYVSAEGEWFENLFCWEHHEHSKDWVHGRGRANFCFEPMIFKSAFAKCSISLYVKSINRFWNYWVYQDGKGCTLLLLRRSPRLSTSWEVVHIRRSKCTELRKMLDIAPRPEAVQWQVLKRNNSPRPMCRSHRDTLSIFEPTYIANGDITLAPDI